MSTPDTVKAQIQALISSANATTGNADTDLTTAVNSLVAGYGQGGSAPVLEDLSITENGTYIPSDGVDGFSKVVANIAASGGGTSGIYMAQITPAEDLGLLEIAHNLGTTDILLVAAWAETLGDVVPENDSTVAKFWARTSVATQRGGNGFSPGYVWKPSNSYAAAQAPNMANYETLTITDKNNVKLQRATSGTYNMYLAGVTYTVIVIAANAEV